MPELSGRAAANLNSAQLTVLAAKSEDEATAHNLLLFTMNQLYFCHELSEQTFSSYGAKIGSLLIKFWKLLQYLAGNFLRLS